MFNDSSMDWKDLDQDEFRILVYKTIYDLERQNASRLLPQFLRNVYEEYRMVEMAKQIGIYPSSSSVTVIAAEQLKMPVGTYEAFLDQAHTRIELLLQKDNDEHEQ
ncbi:hypothetical protein [Halalkalibacter hemicellulosilyticus]|uniref:Uncharacterized protein n=1 Tax=Halalkalibacter hemicellulosilyticusJCM 9152 TaxID=1236971 RepID=W4QCW2_9BACI|nr:hypothetical protein [Halalkalibacter hemicellulosilyticus]GAE29891.1 hypothetical protein JCM9152_1278 [Halalkalibacter hemicellulosilyticusJCM 9152]